LHRKSHGKKRGKTDEAADENPDAVARQKAGENCRRKYKT